MTESTPAGLRGRLLQRSADLSEIARELGLTDLAATIDVDTRRRLEESRLRVVALGEIKHGKSTLLNALVGDDAVPVGVTPTTGSVVRIVGGTRKGHYLVDPAGKREPIERETFTGFVRSGPPEGHQLEAISPTQDLPKEIELVDTPGTNDIKRVRDLLSRGELPRADVLIHVLDATQLLNRTELAFLRDAMLAVGGLGDSGATLFLVINRIDLVDEEEHEKLRGHLREQLEELGPSFADGVDVFLTDARAATKSPDAVTNGVLEVRRLRERLREVADRRDSLLPARARTGLLRHTALLTHHAAISARALTLEADELRREIVDVEGALSDHEADTVAIKEALAQGSEKIVAESNQRLRAFRDQLQLSTMAHVEHANLRTLAQHLPGSIHDAFLTFLHDETERLRGSLDTLTRRVLHTHGDRARRRLAQATMHLGFRGPEVYLDPPSIVLEAGMFAVGLAGTAVMYFGNVVAGVLMTVAGPLTTVALRERSLRQTRAQARMVLPMAMQRTTDAIEEATQQVVSDHVGAVQEQILLASAALGEQLLSLLQQARTQLGTLEADGGEEAAKAKRTTAQKQLRELEARLGSISRELEAIEL